MKIRYTKQGRQTVIHYTNGVSRLQLIEALKKRIAERDEKMNVRRWVVKEYEALEKANRQDKEFADWFERMSDEEFES